MREVERAANAARDVSRDRRWDPRSKLAMTVDQGSQRRTLDELHRDEVVAVDLTELEDLNDVAVGEVRRELRLIDEELEELLAPREAWMNDLERDPLTESGRTELLRLVHR